jgi:hypothetical protein
MDNEKERERDEHLLIFSAQLNGSVFIAFTSKALSRSGPGAAAGATQVTNNNKEQRIKKKKKPTQHRLHIALGWILCSRLQR